MNPSLPDLLVVDDDPINRMILQEGLAEEGYRVEAAKGGVEALAMLQAEPGRYAAVLLDRMMPGLDGLSTLQRIKRDPRTRMLAVIMQTAAAMGEVAAEGLRHGALCCLTKPFDRDALRTVVRAACERTATYRTLCGSVAPTPPVTGSWSLRTLAEAQTLAGRLAAAFPEPHLAVLGLYELLANAVEHGCYGLGEVKMRWAAAGQLEAELARREAAPEYAVRFALVTLTVYARHVEVMIEDPGPGFDWRERLRFAPDLPDSPGSGLATALLSLPRLVYNEAGNQVAVSSEPGR